MSELRPSHGDVTGEYLAARSGAGIVADRHSMFWVTGPDAVSFLQGIISQDVEQLSPGAVGRSLLLEPRGKLRDIVWVLRGEDRVGFVSAADAQATMEELARWKIRVKADLTMEERPVTAVVGPRSTDVVRELMADPPQPGSWSAGPPLVAAVDLGPQRRYFVVGSTVDELVGAGGVPVGSLAYDAVRIEAGEPRMGVDVDEKTIPQEAGLVADTVSFTKGCYLGQELVARIDSRGRVNRSLRGVVVADAVLPPAGATVVHSGEPRGTVTSVAESLHLRAPVGLALVRREVADGDAVTLEWDGGSADAEVRALPLDDFSEVGR